MSYTWHGRCLDPEEPGPRHDLRCRVLTHPGPVLDPEEDCTCRTPSGHTRRRLSTAELLDLIDPGPEPWLHGKGA